MQTLVQSFTLNFSKRQVLVEFSFFLEIRTRHVWRL